MSDIGETPRFEIIVDCDMDLYLTQYKDIIYTKVSVGILCIRIILKTKCALL